MFPSSGLFADIDCPLSRRGLCERPHCSYKHATQVRDDVFGASCESAIVHSAGDQNGFPAFVCRAPVSDETGDDCFQELDRINKEIETVRHEVEQEQRRLSRYQTIQADSRNTVPNFCVSKSETAGKLVDGGSYGLSSRTDFTKAYSRARKYVVDNSKPRTDLEYDPLSNFSADLRSYSSSGKEQKVKNGQGLKRERDAVPFDQKKPVAHARLPQSPSPEPLDDSNEDSVLIIDIPPTPEKKRGRTQKLVDCVAGTSQGTIEELKEVKTLPVLLDSPLLCLANTEVCNDTSPCASRVDANKVSNHCGDENSQYLSTLYENKGGENIPVDGSVVDVTGCLEDLGSECQKITCFQAAATEVENSPETASPPASSDQQDRSWNNPGVEAEENQFRVELPQSELFSIVEKMNPFQPRNFPSKTSSFYKAPASNSDSPCRQHTKQAQTTDQPAQNRAHNHWSPKQSVPSLASGGQKMSSKMPGHMQGGAISNQTSSVRYQEKAEPASSKNQFQTLCPSSTSVNSYLTDRVESPSEATEQHLDKADNEEVIVIISSSEEEEEELNYSDVELSDSDPMEECYRIFMEANENKGNEEQTGLSVGVMDVEKPELDVTPQALPGKKRVAHEAKHTEQPAAKSRPQPQVLVPLRGAAASGFGSQSSIPPKIQQVQQRASMLTASVKGGQAFVSSTCQRQPETQTTACPPTQTSANTQPAPVQNAYMNYLPLGTAVIEVGHNLHLILPEGTFPLPVTSSSGPVTSMLTPVSQMHTSSTVGVKQTYHQAALTPVQRYRTTAPVLIPAPTRKPSLTSASAHSSPAASTTPQPAFHAAAAKSVPTKRKAKQQYETAKDKVPHDVRQRYVNMFTEEFLKTTANVNAAFEKAVAEERTVYNRSVNKLKYLSVAVNSLKRLKNQSAVSAKDENEVNVRRSKGNIPLNLKKLKGGDDMALYESLKDYLLTEERLIESNYPVQHPEKPGSAALFADNKKGNTDPLKRICCRCGATYSVSQTGKHIRKEECNYHYGKGVENRVPGGVETRYSCCQGVMGAPGCQVFKLHVHDSLSLDGFVSTIPRHPSDTSCPGVYSLDCETCYTVHGLELSRVTMVNSSLQIIYDTFVRPDNEVIDYNTRFSGISEEDVKGNNTSVREVQETLLSFISADTVLIGHSLETDLCALKLLHGRVVDTSVVFPHRLGPPHKLTLNNLTAEYLRRIIQESVCGHDTAEDAAACMELMLWKVKEDGKLKK
ncbi:RNA exonuclease 1 homolog isoform X2 [Xiphias gladius]|uniref:RNA exonuclease 1 homolog isoform X2 n=1 Tax=Xiphias gladius TaxID=8245 RepID=UPI001A98137F|nr:RNA exonuclease 1 homolog isoform X2 [Xiphias gladius]